MIFLHVGMHKTATSFLQVRVFPKFKGIEYIPPSTPFDFFLRLEAEKKYLFSNERLAGRLWATGEQVDHSIKRLSELFPGSNVLMSFRRHDGFIVSSYKQYLHQGGILRFSEYFDAQNDTGFMKRDRFNYRTRIESVIRHFRKKPFVFLFDEIRNNLDGLLNDMGSFLEATPPSTDKIAKRALNKGVGYHQGRVLRQVNRWNRSEFNPTGRFRLDNRWTRKLKIDPRRLCLYWLSFLPDGPFVDNVTREAIRRCYQKDWDYVVSCKDSRLDR
jgi:hypothetical protein